MKYWLRCLVGFDIFVNLLTGGNFDETISSRVQRASSAHHSWRDAWKWPGILIAKLLLGGLDWIQRGHGVLAEAGDLARAQMLANTESAALVPPPPKKAA